KEPSSPNRDSGNGRAACPRKIPRRLSTAMVARRCPGSPARAGWKGRSEVGRGAGTPGEGVLYPPLAPGQSGLTKKSFALIDRVRSIDKGRVRWVFGGLGRGGGLPRHWRSAGPNAVPVR